MNSTTRPMNNNLTSQAIAESDTPGWVAFAAVTLSYFVVLLGVVAYCLVLP